MIGNDFKFIDLFCGIGGFHQVMTSLGGRCVLASDINRDCQKTYYDNYGVEVVGDITKVDAKDIEPFNVLCAGFPCQPFSNAGKKLGFRDTTRGTLFFDIIRIAEHHRPEYMLLENVKHLAMHDGGRTWSIIRDTIRRTGYDVLDEPVIFSPHYLGIPQNRERVFIMCIREDLGSVPQFDFDLYGRRRPKCTIDSILLDDSEIEDVEKYRVDERRMELIDLWNDFVKGVGYDMPGIVWDEFLVPSLDMIPGMENRIPWEREVAEKDVPFYNRHREFIDEWRRRAEGVEMFRNARRHLEWQTYRDERGDMHDGVIVFRRSGIRVKKPTFFPTLVAMNTTPIIGKLGRYITPRECARLQSFPDEFKIHPVDSVAYRQFGNSVNVEVVKLFAKYLFGDEETRRKYAIGRLF